MTSQSNTTRGTNRTDRSPNSDPTPELEAAEDPDLQHNAHPLAIRKAVAEAERAAAKAKPAAKDA
jgi:hypothetical protein